MKRIGLKFPLIVAPMAGGPSTPELVAAGSMAGGLGSMGAAYDSGSGIEEFARKVRAKTPRPFGINLFIPSPLQELSQSRISRALEATRTFRQELGLSEVTLAPPFAENFESQFEAVLRVRPAVFSFVFGLLGESHVRALKAAEIYVIGTATCPEEAIALEASGVDAIVLQGIEAGGHRGIFDPDAEDPEIPVLRLLKECKVKLPLIAAGGIMDRAGIQAALQAGAEAVQMGTAFLGCTEAGTSKPYRARLEGIRETKTTRAFSGRLARGVVNKFMRELDPSSILPFPAQNKFTRDIRAASAKAGSGDFLSLWAGTGSGPLWKESAEELVALLFK